MKNSNTIGLNLSTKRAKAPRKGNNQPAMSHINVHIARAIIVENSGLKKRLEIPLLKMLQRRLFFLLPISVLFDVSAFVLKSLIYED